MARLGPLAGALGVLASLGVAASFDAGSGRLPEIAHLVILHTNDMHGQALPLSSGGKERGGFAALACAIDRERRRARDEGAEPLLVDAGDLWVGPLEGVRTEGAFVVDFMGRVGYEAAAVGNHEFDHGVACVERLARSMTFPLLGANVREAASGARPGWLADGKRCRVSGIDVRLVGLVTSEIRKVTARGTTSGLDFEPEETAVLRALGEGPSPDLTVLVTHCGHETDRKLALRFHGKIAAIVGGHSHRPIDPAWHVPEGAEDAVLVAQTGSRTENLGRIDLDVDRKTRRVLRSRGRLIAVRPENGEDPAVRALVEREAAAVEEVYGVRVGALSAPLTREGLNSTLGSFVADRIREASRADFAFTNKGGLRADLASGEVKLRHLHEVDPFGNTIVSMTLSGKEVRALVEAMLAGEPHFVLEVSGLVVSYDPTRKPGTRVVSLVRAGNSPPEELDPSREYRVATNSFLASGGDGHEGFLAGRARDEGPLLVRDAIRRHFETNDRVSPPASTTRLIPITR